MMKLRQLAMRWPNHDCIQAPSQIRPAIEFSSNVVASIISSQMSTVSLEADGLSNPQQILSYNLPMEIKTESGKSQTWIGRYIAVDE